MSGFTKGPYSISVASVSGLYSFTVNFVVQTVPTKLAITINDVNSCHGYGDNSHFGNTGTCTTIVELAAGDLVIVKVVDNVLEMVELSGGGVSTADFQDSL